MGYFFSFPQVLKIQKRTASWAGLYLCCILNYYWPDRQNEQHPTAAGETAHTFIAESVLALCLGCFARPKLRVLFLHTFSNCFLIVVVLSIRSVNKETSLTQLNSVEFCLAKVNKTKTIHKSFSSQNQSRFWEFWPTKWSDSFYRNRSEAQKTTWLQPSSPTSQLVTAELASGSQPNQLTNWIQCLLWPAKALMGIKLYVGLNPTQVLCSNP